VSTAFRVVRELTWEVSEDNCDVTEERKGSRGAYGHIDRCSWIGFVCEGKEEGEGGQVNAHPYVECGHVSLVGSEDEGCECESGGAGG